jgi:hypothetical protein
MPLTETSTAWVWSTTIGASTTTGSDAAPCGNRLDREVPMHT